MACTDCATGRVIWVDSKFIKGVEPFPWGAAITGNINPHAVLAAIERHNPVTPTAMFEEMPAILSTVAGMAAAEGLMSPQCAIAMAVYSRRKKRVAVMACDMDGSVYGHMMPPMTSFSTWGIFAGAASPADILGREVDPLDPTSFDPERDGVELVSVQRRRTAWAPRPGDAIAHRIGGGVQLMRVNKRGVSIKTLHTWDEDRPGELINALGISVAR
jgi:hypothetical protein